MDENIVLEQEEKELDNHVKTVELEESEEDDYYYNDDDDDDDEKSQEGEDNNINKIVDKNTIHAESKKELNEEMLRLQEELARLRAETEQIKAETDQQFCRRGSSVYEEEHIREKLRHRVEEYKVELEAKRVNEEMLKKYI